MIPLPCDIKKQPSTKISQKPLWQSQLAQAFSCPLDLLAFLKIDAGNILELNASRAASAFKMRVPRGFAQKMQASNPDDPLLRQVLPIGKELDNPPEFLSDPVGDQHAKITPHLLHKYRQRVLLVASAQCAVNCRFCFRREYPYQAHGDFSQELAYIRAHPDIKEVILSGGDPLMLNDNQLGKLIAKLNQIEHIGRLRIHSRMPIVLPSRVDDGFLNTLQTARAKWVMVVHCNHAQELGADVHAAISALKAIGVTCLSQTVLLKNVNDDLATLCELMEQLFNHGILPYYLHTLDKVRGSAHFDIPQADALCLYDALRAHLSGYLVPRLVTEIQGEPYKTLLHAPLAF